MGLFDRLFGGGARRSGSDIPQDAEAVLEKIRSFMLVEEAQNRAYSAAFQQMMAAGGAVDEIAGAVGEFGRDIRNPIPVNGPTGELVYISRMALPGGCTMMGHRLGSIDTIDVYETVALDGSRWDLLFFDPYHMRKSKRLPSGYQVTRVAQPFLLATNMAVPAFPLGMYEAMSECTARVIGISLVSPQLREERLFRGFSRPLGHLRSVEALRLHGRTQARSGDTG
jgi:hypothetical protein